jgi:predicted transcriptional regulator
MSAIPAVATTQPLVSRIVSSYAKKNDVPPADLPTVISTVYKSPFRSGESLRQHQQSRRPSPSGSAIGAKHKLTWSSSGKNIA